MGVLQGDTGAAGDLNGGDRGLLLVREMRLRRRPSLLAYLAGGCELKCAPRGLPLGFKILKVCLIQKSCHYSTYDYSRGHV